MMRNLKFRFKTILVALVLVAGSFLLASCGVASYDLSLTNDAVFSHLVVRSGENTLETFTFNANALTLLSPSQKADIIDEVFALFQSEGQNLHLEIQNRLADDEAVKNAFLQNTESFRIGIEDARVFFIISYKSNDIWAAVSAKSEPQQVITEKVFLTITKYDRDEKIGTVKVAGNQELYFADFLIETSKQLFSSQASEVYDNVLVKSSYTYATTSKRRHTNADVLAYSQGFYYHQWDTSTQNDVSFYYTNANAGVWYGFAIFVGFLTLGIVFGKVKLDERREKLKLIAVCQEVQGDLQQTKAEEVKETNQVKQEDKPQNQEEDKPRIKTKEE
ncbi:MAG: hypothetical protein ACOX6H_01675 [Christensenellales bacterium]|jgi:hypothetical protein